MSKYSWESWALSSKSPRAHGWRIDHYLSRVFGNFSREQFKQAVAEGRVLVNGLPVKPARRLRVNDRLSVRLPAAPDATLPPEDIPLDVLYEDEALVVINKAAGMIVHPGRGNYRGTLAGALYGIASSVVQHIEMVEHITPLPNAPAAVEGVVFSRGQVIPILDLRRRFGFAPIAHDLRTRLVVVHTGGRTVGLRVDTAREFIAIPRDAIQPPPETLTQLSSDYLVGIATLGERYGRRHATAAEARALLSLGPAPAPDAS